MASSRRPRDVLATSYQHSVERPSRTRKPTEPSPVAPASWAPTANSEMRRPACLFVERPPGFVPWCHHDLGFYGKKGFERESTRIRDFIPAGPVPLFPQGCPFIPAGLSF
jgi:hypothetical protein